MQSQRNFTLSIFDHKNEENVSVDNDLLPYNSSHADVHDYIGLDIDPFLQFESKQPMAEAKDYSSRDEKIHNIADHNLDEIELSTAPSAKKSFNIMLHDLKFCIDTLKKAHKKASIISWSTRAAILTGLSYLIYFCTDLLAQERASFETESERKYEDSMNITMSQRENLAEIFFNLTIPMLSNLIFRSCPDFYPTMNSSMHDHNLDSCCDASDNSNLQYQSCIPPKDYYYSVPPCDKIINEYCATNLPSKPKTSVKIESLELGTYLLYAGGFSTAIIELLAACSQFFNKFVNVTCFGAPFNQCFVSEEKINKMKSIASKYNIQFDQYNLALSLKNFETVYENKISIRKTFLLGSRDNRSSLHSFFKNELFDKQVLPLIFEHLEEDSVSNDRNNALGL